MRYSVGFSQAPNQKPFMHFEADTPFPAVIKGSYVALSGRIWEITSVLHQFQKDSQNQDWAIIFAVVTAPSTHALDSGDFVPWPW